VTDIDAARESYRKASGRILIQEGGATFAQVSAHEWCVLLAHMKIALDDRDRLSARLAEVEKERNEVHATLKSVVDYALDSAGMPTSFMLGPDAPLRVMRKLHDERGDLEARVDRLVTARDADLRERGGLRAELEQWRSMTSQEREMRQQAERERDEARAELQRVTDERKDKTLAPTEWVDKITAQSEGRWSICPRGSRCSAWISSSGPSSAGSAT
jgi:uncharacterized protein YhaN